VLPRLLEPLIEGIEQVAGALIEPAGLARQELGKGGLVEKRLVDMGERLLQICRLKAPLIQPLLNPGPVDRRQQPLGCLPHITLCLRQIR
jgi:hypothetical protein